MEAGANIKTDQNENEWRQTEGKSSGHNRIAKMSPCRIDKRWYGKFRKQGDKINYARNGRDRHRNKTKMSQLSLKHIPGSNCKEHEGGVKEFCMCTWMTFCWKRKSYPRSIFFLLNLHIYLFIPAFRLDFMKFDICKCLTTNTFLDLGVLMNKIR